MGPASRMGGGAEPSEPIEPGKSLVKAAKFAAFGFCEGVWGENVKIIGPYPPNGKYKASIVIHFLLGKQADENAVPVWKHDEIVTHAIEIESSGLRCE
jgi:hypothetical protein